MPITPPVCKICGKAHWLRDGHVFAASKPALEKLAVDASKRVAAKVKPRSKTAPKPKGRKGKK